MNHEAKPPDSQDIVGKRSFREISEAAKRIEHIERACDDIGREKVFSKATELGWQRTDDVPIWVWEGIIYELRRNK